ncbi:MAG: Spi family protease inhibitor [Muribaculaceae bacterium]|nr:Spi family protease inhibitor [Muribaculaceae bacterium]
MKKTTLCFLSCALLAGSLLTGCSSDEPLPAPAPAPEGVSASRSVADAEAIALALAEGRQGESRFGEQVFVDGVVALTTPGSRSGSADTLIYAVNYADNKGFALIAAPVAAEPIIGFTEQGSFDEETAAGNPAFSFYLDAAKSYAASKVSSGDGGVTI